MQIAARGPFLVGGFVYLRTQNEEKRGRRVIRGRGSTPENIIENNTSALTVTAARARTRGLVIRYMGNATNTLFKSANLLKQI